MCTGFTGYGSYSDLPLNQLDRWLLRRGIFAHLMGEKRQVFGPAFDEVFTQVMFSNYLGDQGTCLSVRPVVAYINTLLRPSVAEHLAHPIA